MCKEFDWAASNTAPGCAYGRLFAEPTNGLEGKAIVVGVCFVLELRLMGKDTKYLDGLSWDKVQKLVRTTAKLLLNEHGESRSQEEIVLKENELAKEEPIGNDDFEVKELHLNATLHSRESTRVIVTLEPRATAT